MSHVYRLYDADDVLLYIGHTSNFEHRLRLHLNPVTNKYGRLPGADEIKARYHHHTLDEYEYLADAVAAERAAIEAEAPLLNRAHNPKRFRKDGLGGRYVATDYPPHTP